MLQSNSSGPSGVHTRSAASDYANHTTKCTEHPSRRQTPFFHPTTRIFASGNKSSLLARCGQRREACPHRIQDRKMFGPALPKSFKNRNRTSAKPLNFYGTIIRCGFRGSCIINGSVRRGRRGEGRGACWHVEICSRRGLIKHRSSCTKKYVAPEFHRNLGQQQQNIRCCARCLRPRPPP